MLFLPRSRLRVCEAEGMADEGSQCLSSYVKES